LLRAMLNACKTYHKLTNVLIYFSTRHRHRVTNVIVRDQ